MNTENSQIHAGNFLNVKPVGVYKMRLDIVKLTVRRRRPELTIYASFVKFNDLKASYRV
jgi:hypothetical protein